MNQASEISRDIVLQIRDQCLCLAAQRTARQLARRFDRVFAPLGLTNGQFSLMVALQSLAAPRPGQLAAFLAMDQTTVTASIKALTRRGLVAQAADAADLRARRVSLTPEGWALLVQATQLWTAEHAALAAERVPAKTAQRARFLAGLATPKP